jgi:D-3-phosphoglycerate dehydrogenase
MSKILLIDPIPLPMIERMRPMFPAGANLDIVSSLSEDDLAQHAAETEILLVIQRKVDAHLLSIVPRVRFVQRVGVGYDNLDLEALQAAGIVAAYTPGSNAFAVAEHTILLMLALLKRFPAANRPRARAVGLQWSCSRPVWEIWPIPQLALSALAASDTLWPSD